MEDVIKMDHSIEDEFNKDLDECKSFWKDKKKSLYDGFKDFTLMSVMISF